jgi:hypothetical protein
MTAQTIKEFMCPPRITSSPRCPDLSGEAMTLGEAGPMPIPRDPTEIRSFGSFQARSEPMIIRDIENNRFGHLLAANTLRFTSFSIRLCAWAIAGIGRGMTWERNNLRPRRTNLPIQSRRTSTIASEGYTQWE